MGESQLATKTLELSIDYVATKPWLIPNKVHTILYETLN